MVRADQSPLRDPRRAARGAQSVHTALRVIELLTERRSLRVREAARLLEISEPTAYRVLAALHARHWVTKDHSRAYHAGLGLAHMISRPRTAELAALPFLAAVSEATGHSANFGILEGNGLRSLLGITPRQCRIAPRDGWLLPAHVTSAGQVLLAELEYQELKDLYPLGVPSSPRHADLDLRELRRLLAGVRRRGWAMNDEVSERGIVALAVPMNDAVDGRAVGALALVGSARQTTSQALRTHLPLLQEAAAQATNALAAANHSTTVSDTGPPQSASSCQPSTSPHSL